ncbi:translation initiation factor eIF-2B subunit epsilon, partial [Tremellales sp. Uapishka_1]
MPPKKPHPTKGEAKPSKPETEEAPLQAILLADSYNRRFEVMCTDKPRILLPLCSTPLLSWTLESLSLSKVKQVFIFCGVHADKIREYIADTPFRSILDIQCFASQTAMSAGDALRELDSMNVLNPEKPFILVHSPLISNYDLSKMIEAHQQRREKSSECIMTMGVGRGGRRHPEAPILLVHPASSRLLHYSPHPISPSQPRLILPSDLFAESSQKGMKGMDEFEIWAGTPSAFSSSRGGYRDLGVDICEADVPALCTENFDYHDMRRDFVNGVLTSELLGKTISVHLVGGEELDDVTRGDPRCGEGGRYVERVRDTRTFGDITRDVLRRWAFPLVPDLNEPGGIQYELRKGNVYVAKDNVVLSRIGADCVLEECMVGDDVELADGVRVGRGVLIGNGVKLGKDVVVPDFSRIGRERWVEDEDDEGETEEERDSTGYLWPQEEEQESSDSEDEGDPYEHARNKRLLQLGRRLSNVTSSTHSFSTLSAASSSPPGSPESMASSASLPAIATIDLDAVPPAFHVEAAASLARAFDEGHSVENALLELRTLVMGYNAGIDRAREEVVNFLMSKISVGPGAKQVLESATEIWERWGKLAEELGRDAAQTAIDVQSYCVANATHSPWFGIILRAMYDADILAEEALIEWRSLSTAKGEGAKDAEEKKRWLEVYAKGKQYVDVLEDMESEEDSEEEDDGEEEESE